MAQRIIFFSGMGADQRAFQFLDLGDIERVYVTWIEPEDDETLRDYSARLVKDMEFYEDDVVIGLSMGGMVAQEVAAMHHVSKVILISSLRSGETLQPLFTAAQKLKLMRLMQKDLLRNTIVKGARIFLPLNDKRLQVIVDMLDRFSGHYYKWAMNAVLNWQGADARCPVYHVHGSKDEMFPLSQVRDAVIIDKGTHLMIVTKPKEVSKQVKVFLDS